MIFSLVCVLFFASASFAFTPALNAALAAAQSPAIQCFASPLSVESTGTRCSCLSAYHVYQCASHEPRQLHLFQGNGSLDLSAVPTLESLKIANWTALPKLTVTGLTRLTHLSVALSASPLRDAASNALFLDEIVGLDSLCHLGKLRTLEIKFVGLRELDLTGCAQLEALNLFGLMGLTRFVLANTPALAVAEVANVFAAEDSARQQLQAHPSLFYLQFTENPHVPTAAVTDGWRGFACRVNPTAPMFTKPGGICNLGRVCYFNAGNCASTCSVVAEPRCATGRFCPPPTVAASRCAKGVEFDVAFELFNAATPTSDDHVCIKFAQTIHGKVSPVDGAECKIAQVESSAKGVAAGLAGVTFSSCSFQFSDDRTRIVSLVLTSAATQARLGTAGFECGARFSLISPAATYAGNTTTLAGRVVGTGSASALAVQDMTITSDGQGAPTPTTEPLNRAAIGLAVVLVLVLAVWVVSCAVLTLRMRRAREDAAAAAAQMRELQSAAPPSERRQQQRRRRSSRRVEQS